MFIKQASAFPAVYNGKWKDIKSYYIIRMPTSAALAEVLLQMQKRNLYW